MRIEDVAFRTIHWATEAVTSLPGSSGFALTKTVQAGKICLRMVEFTAGYASDHWCSKGHIAFVVAGSLTIEIQDGHSVERVAGESFHVGDNENCHRARSHPGATVIIID